MVEEKCPFCEGTTEGATEALIIHGVNHGEYEVTRCLECGEVIYPDEAWEVVRDVLQPPRPIAMGIILQKTTDLNWNRTIYEGDYEVVGDAVVGFDTTFPRTMKHDLGCLHRTPSSTTEFEPDTAPKGGGRSVQTERMISAA